MRILFTLILLFLPFSASAAEYEIDYNASTITFSGEHAGNDFKGVFEEWNAEIFFDKNDLESAHIKTTFNLASAKTGNAMYNGTLPQADWFDVKNHPSATFTSTAITKMEDSRFQMDGNLTLKGQTLPITFPFTLEDKDGKTHVSSDTFPIDRLIFNIGKGSDPAAEWVSQEIQLQLNLVALKK